MEMPIESTLTAQKLPLQSFQTQSPSFLHNVKLVRWCWMYSLDDSPCASAITRSTLRYRFCTRHAAEEQRAENHQLRGDEAAEHRHRLEGLHGCENRSEHQHRQQQLADLADPRRAHDRGHALVTALPQQPRGQESIRNHDRHAAEQSRLPGRRSHQTPERERRYEAHTYLYEQRHWHDVLHVNHSGPLATPGKNWRARQVGHDRAWPPFGRGHSTWGTPRRSTA